MKHKGLKALAMSLARTRILVQILSPDLTEEGMHVWRKLACWWMLILLSVCQNYLLIFVVIQLVV